MTLPAVDDPVRGHADTCTLQTMIERHPRRATGTTYANFIGEKVCAGALGFADGTLERLAPIEAAWDPQNVFRDSHNLRPAT